MYLSDCLNIWLATFVKNERRLTTVHIRSRIRHVDFEGHITYQYLNSSLLIKIKKHNYSHRWWTFFRWAYIFTSSFFKIGLNPLGNCKLYCLFLNHAAYNFYFITKWSQSSPSLTIKTWGIFIWIAQCYAKTKTQLRVRQINITHCCVTCIPSAY